MNLKETGQCRALKRQLSMGLAGAAALLTSLTHAADADTVMPLSGKLECNTVYRHNVPIAADRPNFIMVTSGRCTVENASPDLVHEYVMSLEFDDKGVGTLISGIGLNLHMEKPIATHKFAEAKYTLKFKDGAVVGWSAEGELVWNSGESMGKSTVWTAYATGPESLVINYKTE